ncbi:hypothetical protein GRF59_00755 [Paenibacillus sp. HJL G12]|uniref:DUF6199 domain-containing protein n=1 Tax=Paenibacillus dendrobii TaxID=2691084 RepID=A0A7X3IDY6_9BACL|nr:hypothetical protein [Paenibacillus dendrobii]MWV42147.1 hypothetical protein [Paenibacillus dendrobii]
MAKKLTLSTILIIIGLMLAAVAIIIFAKSYFSVHVFHVNNHTYRQSAEQSNIITYRANSGPSIAVHAVGQDRKVIINNEEFTIHRTSDSISSKYQVVYPNGKKYEVDDQDRFLLSRDENGEFIPDISMYVNNQRVLQDGEELYFPGELVTAAYPEYHSKRGSLFLFIVSILLLIYGWCGYRFEKFQRFLFFMSLRWVWVNDPEPSDFYYFMSKVGGVLTMIGAFILAIYSLQLELLQ